MNSRGLGLIEVLVALGLLSLIAIAVLSAIVSHVNANTRNEIRTEAVGIAQDRLEDLRLQDPTGLKDESDPPDSWNVTVDARTYELRTHYCLSAEYCPPASPYSRHLIVEVYLSGTKVYDVETVYTQLR